MGMIQMDTSIVCEERRTEQKKKHHYPQTEQDTLKFHLEN